MKIVDGPATGATGRIRSMKVYDGVFKAAPDQKTTFFLAHELQEVKPEAVTGKKDERAEIGTLRWQELSETGETITVEQHNVTCPLELPEGTTWEKTGDQARWQAVDHSKLIPDLVASLQEAWARIDALEKAAG
jgi:hypothetical protein